LVADGSAYLGPSRGPGRRTHPGPAPAQPGSRGARLHPDRPAAHQLGPHRTSGRGQYPRP